MDSYYTCIRSAEARQQLAQSAEQRLAKKKVKKLTEDKKSV